MPDNFGERAATEDEVEDWVELVRAGKAAQRGWRNQPGEFDHLRPAYGSGRASSAGEED